MMRYEGYGGYGHMGLFGGVIMFFIALAVIGLLIYLVVLLSRSAKSHSAISSNFVGQIANPQNLNNALSILSERYARGEVDDEEYARKKAALLKL